MDDGIQESHITNRDIGDISYAKKFGFDSITISGISRPEDVNEVSFIFFWFYLKKNKKINTYLFIVKDIDRLRLIVN